MTVVEKIHQLLDRRLCLLCFTKTYETSAEVAEINKRLEKIRVTCPNAWEASQRARDTSSGEVQ